MHRDGEFHRFDQSIGKQYTYGHGSDEVQNTSEKDRIKQLEMQSDIKKVSGVGKEVESEVVIQLVEFYKGELTGELTQKKVLEVLNVSRTTYNRWRK